jgi:hypothetical protein
MQTVFCAFFIGLLGSVCLEYLLLVPRRSVRIIRLVSTWLVHVGTWATLFFALLCIVQRPWFAVFLVTALQLLLLAANFAKYRSLKEPFLLQDFEYFLDLIRHPRLYLPFFGIANAIAGVLLFIGFFVTGLIYDTPVETVISLALVLAIGAFLMVRTAVRFGLSEPCFEPDKDLARFGMVAFFWVYYRAFQHQSKLIPNPAFTRPLHDDNTDWPDIVVVQSESFFDPRVCYRGIRDDVLDGFDRVSGESLYAGQLMVPAWGANTVRTESAFLTGLTPDDLGIFRFNPYWYLAQEGLPNLVSALRDRGYQTVCVHPYSAGFYLRDKVFPRLGFDLFIDIDAFSGKDKDGQYISDAAVASEVKNLLGQSSSNPLFVFVITMENHGPLHLESAVNIDKKQFYNTEPPAGCDDLTIYLRHLKNADNMLRDLTEYLCGRERTSLLCWYGDHVPVMSNVYRILGAPAAETPYLLWCSGADYQNLQGIKVNPTSISQLPLLLLEHAEWLAGAQRAGLLADTDPA